MPYVGGKLTSFFRDHGKLTDAALRDIASKQGDRMQEKAVENTPIGGVDDQFGSPGGNLRSSWWRKPTNKKQGPLGTEYKSEVGTDVKYAPFIEHGWGLWGPNHAKYKITPKKAGGMLRWRSRETGQWVFARSVMHPGAPGQHMLQIAASIVEATWAADSQGVLDTWAKAIEQQAD